MCMTHIWKNFCTVRCQSGTGRELGPIFERHSHLFCPLLPIRQTQSRIVMMTEVKKFHVKLLAELMLSVSVSR